MATYIPVDANGNVDTELPLAAPLTDDMSAVPTVPQIGAIVLGMSSDGQVNIDRARLAKAHNVDTSGSTTEYATGVVLRRSASGGSLELGTTTTPMRVDPVNTTSQTVITGAAESARLSVQDDVNRRINEQILLQQMATQIATLSLGDSEGARYDFVEIR